MIDRVTRADFIRWLDANQEDFLDAIPQNTRSVRDWVADLHRAQKLAAANMGRDRGHAGVFGESELEGAGDLHDPEGDDEEDEETY